MEMAGTVADMKGTYGYYRFGENHSTSPASDIASVGYLTFDGKGGTTDSQQTSRSGVYDPTAPVFPPPVSGFYTVGSNNTFALFDSNHNVLSNGVIVDDGNELYSLARTPNNGVIVVGKRMPQISGYKVTTPPIGVEGAPKI